MKQPTRFTSRPDSILDDPKLLHRQTCPKASCGFGLTAHRHGVASHELLKNALRALSRMEHRGTVSRDKKTGDGCGILLKKPDRFLRTQCLAAGVSLPPTYAVGVIFMPSDASAEDIIDDAIRANAHNVALRVAHTRRVPVDATVLGVEGRAAMPNIYQYFFVQHQPSEATPNWRLQLFTLERTLRQRIKQPLFHIASLSLEMIAYKGMMIPDLLPLFYSDLADPALTTAICIFHQRFATNTLPAWSLAQPFATLAHNGEINSIAGNRNWAQARVPQFVQHSVLSADILQPAVSNDMSDSASLNDMLQLLMAGGMDILTAIRVLVPPAFRSGRAISDEEEAFFAYHALHMEPWDGPAGLVLTDGRYAVCTLDRHGLRPARWILTDDDVVMLASEVGLHNPNAQIVRKGRVSPGAIIAIDTANGAILERRAVDKQLACTIDYRPWLEANVLALDTLNTEASLDGKWQVTKNELQYLQKLFQLDTEERTVSLLPLATSALEATSSMGDDTPIAALSTKTRMLSDYFRQQFAQVTNPPIDPIREGRGMLLDITFGTQQAFFDHRTENSVKITAPSPVLSEQQFASLLALADHPQKTVRQTFAHCIIHLRYTAQEGIKAALLRIQQQAVVAVQEGAGLLIVSDKQQSQNHLTLNALLAVGAIHHALINSGNRLHTSIVVATGIMRDSHQLATLLGFGANAVYPYLAYASIAQLAEACAINAIDAVRSYRKGIDKALLKIMSKMGISCVSSYCGAKLFEALGLHPEVVDICFTGCHTPIGGTTFTDLQQDDEIRKRDADNNQPLSNNGLVKYTHFGEFHCYNPAVVTALIESVKIGDYANYKATYADPINNRTPAAIRDLLSLRESSQKIAFDKVESVASIMRRFDTAGMSIGALGPEAHEVLAMAMNRIGGRSNSGEGGEDVGRFGTSKNSKIKQIASGRFGVTPGYLMSAEVLQIKIAQGAKPGEGGQLPSEKVNAMIARLRCSTEGVTLISPPPHHDIYSIEDIAQLIFDLKQINPDVLVSVKLVAQPGIGTISAGLTKAYADLITISGHDGGTGASPLSSIRYAGSAWELGLTEVQQALRINGLRDRVLLQADGGLKTGLDVIKAAILGAESFGFGTAALVAMGCKYIRVCHLNNCPTGVNTQNPQLRAAYFQGEVARVVNFFRFVATEVRAWLAYLGVATLDAIIGNVNFLQVATHNLFGKQQHLCLEKLLHADYVTPDTPKTCLQRSNKPHDTAALAALIESHTKVAIETNQNCRFPTHGEQLITNSDRSIGANVSGIIAKRYGEAGLTANVMLHFFGSAGQSFGVWNAHGLHLRLHGDANDYVGKGMAGGSIVITPPSDALFASDQSSIIGNTSLYGATGGVLYASGCTGERFAVRNSGVIAVAEGAGDHLCEYMTGGVVLILGEIGINMGAGMTGGIAFVYTDMALLQATCNPEVTVTPLTANSLAYQLVHDLLTDYCTITQSKRGVEVLARLVDYPSALCQVQPVNRKEASLLSEINFRPLDSRIYSNTE